MSDRVPPQEQGSPIELAAIELRGVPFVIGPHPAVPDEKCLMLGPVMLVVPLSEANVRVVLAALTGVTIVPANAMPPAPDAG